MEPEKTDLEITLEQLGETQTRDLEHARLTQLKYINFGKKIARLESGILSPEEKLDLVHQAMVSGANEALEQVAIMFQATGEKASAVELEEREMIEALKLIGEDGPVKEQLLAAMSDLVKTIDEKHKAIYQERRNALAALFAKYKV